VKVRAKESLLTGLQIVHTDDLYDVDDCLEIAQIDGYHIHLIPTSEKVAWEPNNGYHIVPKPLVKRFMQLSVTVEIS